MPNRPSNAPRPSADAVAAAHSPAPVCTSSSTHASVSLTTLAAAERRGGARPRYSTPQIWQVAARLSRTARAPPPPPPPPRRCSWVRCQRPMHEACTHRWVPRQPQGESSGSGSPPSRQIRHCRSESAPPPELRSRSCARPSSDRLSDVAPSCPPCAPLSSCCCCGCCCCSLMGCSSELINVRARAGPSRLVSCRTARQCSAAGSAAAIYGAGIRDGSS
jgi:hypothetical protein